MQIDAQAGEVVVTLPVRSGRRAGLALLEDHAAWVAERLAALPRPVCFTAGVSVPIAGEPYFIHHCPGTRGGAWIAEGEILVAGDLAFLPRRVADLLRAEARRRLSALVASKAASAEVTCRRLVFKDMRTRWGSCAPNGSIALSWRLVMAPAFVQDYVTAHEVAHLRHLNHGPRFWALVAALTPHAARAKAWLAEQGATLLRIG